MKNDFNSIINKNAIVLIDFLKVENRFKEHQEPFKRKSLFALLIVSDSFLRKKTTTLKERANTFYTMIK
ncbi:hypothetical protein [uncultured Polaribacter sp.]|uniref:hypothetical protein n=1 Tax=uncultured Polaribacter sp. TaxID=174711 RepID=UPI002638B52C|nr:hypothetical protein [uncultured Polaribacter sp.]